MNPLRHIDTLRSVQEEKEDPRFLEDVQYWRFLPGWSLQLKIDSITSSHGGCVMVESRTMRRKPTWTIGIPSRTYAREVNATQISVISSLPRSLPLRI